MKLYAEDFLQRIITVVAGSREDPRTLINFERFFKQARVEVEVYRARTTKSSSGLISMMRKVTESGLTVNFEEPLSIRGTVIHS